MTWEQIAVPTDLPEVVDDISYQRVMMNAGATWDYFPGHCDPGSTPATRWWAAAV